MKISIVSPSFNQAAFIDATIASVAAQAYPHKEHIICDGGSTDGSVAKIHAAATLHPHVHAIVEVDRGQADAINKGLRLATGDVLAWINTDDKYTDPDAFAAVAAEFERHPEADLIYARGRRIGPDGAFIREAYINRGIDGADALKTKMGVFQPSVFFRRSVFEKVGGLSEAYNLQLDYEYWIRMLQAGVRFHFMDKILAEAIVHDDAKSTRDRLLQLSECISMIEDRYGDVPDEWIDRFARFDATRRDEKVAPGQNMNAQEEEAARLTRAAVNAALGRSIPEEPPRIILTSFDSKYFQQGLNLIASLHRTSFASFDEVVVYSLGLTDGEKDLLSGLAKVRVVSYPDETPKGFPDFHEPRGRAYKVAAIAGAGLDVAPGSLVLWMDAGLCCCTDVEEIFDKIAADEFFITDHDDSAFWPFFNVHFLHRGAVDAIGPTKEELLAPHLCSCLVGYKAGGRFQALIDNALLIGQNRAAVVWPKVLKAEEKPRNHIPAEENRSYRDTLLDDPVALDALTIDDLYKRFPYYGHRTQSIYSVLAARYGAPSSSATLFHKSNAHSSNAAAANWSDGADKTHQSAARGAYEGVSADTRLYHHRGVFTDLSGLIFDRSSEPVLIVGNGPSLRGFDFELLRGKAWVGMNAAYRFWDEQKLYPHIYVCFDTTVQDSHRDEIKRLIENRRQYGIRWFFLRESFLEFWPEAADLGCVFFLESLQKNVEWLDRGKITTGSFSLYVTAFLGFSEVYILGVDLNYVEQIGEAEKSGRELVITGDVASNPNYFFDRYQRPGDRYNPPNRHPDMHMRSWQEAADVLGPFPIDVYNCNQVSCVREFPFVARDRTIAGLQSRQLRALRAAKRACSYAKRRTYWRTRLLSQLGAPEVAVPALRSAQAQRLGAWVRTDGMRQETRIVSGDDGMARSAHAHVDETAVVGLLLSHRRGRGHVMLDVGAHHGSSAQYFNRLDWSIYCFEPDPANRAKLHARFGATDGIVIDPRAVSAEPASNVSLFASEESSGISGLHAFRETHRETARVEVTNVASIIVQHGLSGIDFLKIDVEGFDFAVLKGVPWDDVRPDVIECEFEDAKTNGLGHTWRDIAALLKDKGYAIYLSEWHPIVRYGIRHDWRRVTPLEQADIAPESWGNILAFRDDPGLSAVRDAFRRALKTHGAKVTPIAIAPAGAPSRDAPPQATVVAMQRQLPRPFYVPLAHELRDRAPPLFTALRFCKQVAATLWRRRTITIPAALGLAAWMIAGLFFTAWSGLIWGSGAFAFLSLTLGFVALRVRQLMERVANNNAMLQQHLERTQLELVSANARINAVTRDAARLSNLEKKDKAAIAAVRTQLAQSEKNRIDASARVAESFARLNQLLDGVETQVAALKVHDEQVAAELAQAFGDISNRIAEAEHSATFNNSKWYQRFNRRLSAEHIETLKHWAKQTPLKPTAQAMGYAAHRACLVEARMSGRLATSLEDALLRTIIAMSVKRANIDVLEIGTLFGIGAGVMFDAMAPHFKNVHFTLLDPLDGYYGTKRLDILTGQPISEGTLRRNLAEVALGGDNLTLIKRLSTEPEAIELAQERKYDVIVIDGDHTYQGVKADFDLYAPMLRQNGIVIFDDYGSQDWPDVKAFVDAEVAPLETFEHVCHEWRTCAYRRKRKRKSNNT